MGLSQEQLDRIKSIVREYRTDPEKGKAQITPEKYEDRKAKARAYWHEHKSLYNRLKKKDRAENPEKYLERGRKYRKENRERKNRNDNLSKRNRTFGIDQSQFDSLLENQEGKCAICGRTDNYSRKNFAIDHDHDSGEIRGLLCTTCNTRLGFLENNFESIMEYLINPPARAVLNQ